MTWTPMSERAPLRIYTMLFEGGTVGSRTLDGTAEQCGTARVHEVPIQSRPLPEPWREEP